MARVRYSKSLFGIAKSRIYRPDMTKGDRFLLARCCIFFFSQQRELFLFLRI